MAISEKADNKIHKEFSEEKGFNSVLRNAFKVDKTIKGNRKYVLVIIILLSAILCFPISHLSNSHITFLSFLDIGFAFSIGILGFLITGFSVYATFMDKKLMYFLVIYRDKGKEFNKFHENYLYFFKPFFYFLLLLSFSIIVKVVILSWPSVKSLIDPIIISSCKTLAIFDILWSLIFIFYFLLIYLCICSLKDFIYNIYNCSKTFARFNFMLNSNNTNTEEGFSKFVEMISKECNED